MSKEGVKTRSVPSGGVYSVPEDSAPADTRGQGGLFYAGHAGTFLAAIKSAQNPKRAAN